MWSSYNWVVFVGLLCIIILFCLLVAGIWRLESSAPNINVNSAVGLPSNLSFDPTIQNQASTKKNFALPTNTDVEVCDIKGAGIIKCLWLALSGEPSTTSVKIYVDGAATPYVGNSTSTSSQGINNSPVFASMLLGIDGKNSGTVSTSFMTNVNGMNRDCADALGGYICLDMPYAESIRIVINCISSQNSTYNGFAQIFYEPVLRVPAPFSPLRLYSSTFNWNATFGMEYPLLNASGPLGVFLKGIKISYNGGSGSWYEGRHRVYCGGPGQTSPFSSLHYTDGSYTDVTPYDPNAQVIYTSSGAEDFHMSSWGFINNPNGTSSDSSGYLYSSNPTTEANPNVFSASSTWIATRYFGEGKEKGLPHSTNGQNLLFTWACGDPIANNTGACSIHGIVFFYA